MTRTVGLVLGCALMSAVADAQGPPQGPVGTAVAIQRNYAQLKNNITASAEKLPDADYSFKPTPDVRSFGQLWGHVADAQFGQCSGIKGVPNPRQGQPTFEQLTSKADIQKALADSFAFCDDVFASLTDESATQMVSNGRGGQQSRIAGLMGVLTHGSEMYGIGTVYLRLKGQVPPSTELFMRGRGAGGGRGGGEGRGR
ncbi:MAG TPA: DinB family protein [Vicinamibacterales bacterium]|nr:DinB family protein [Vicinamibacterales bacterium]